ncbi:MAG: hypothetical protein LIP04_04645 [Tannerellaceae bacterium]|nr:hypothetical protein [Tannerellaceae bacterium]
MEDSRRNFLKKGVLAGVGAMLIPELAKAVVAEQTAGHASKITLQKEAVIMMQGTRSRIREETMRITDVTLSNS